MPDKTIAAWLADVGLPQYVELFTREQIDLRVLPELTDDDLTKLGVPLGPRKLLLKAISGLSASGMRDALVRASPPSVLHAERRQLTVMFCDLVGSTQLSQELDPEALRELMTRYQRACTGVVERYDGHIAQYLGDGIMVYFGWPRAHEDDAERSVRAAIDIQAAVTEVAAPAPLQVRIGIATGPVVVGETGGGDPAVPKAAVGETPNLAARLQGLATAGQIVIGPSTQRLIGSAFELEDLGRHHLKGIVDLVQAWSVLSVKVAEGRFEARHGGKLTPFVGREDEIDLLLRRWSQASQGKGQIVMLCGEPGIGKSRITQALRERLEGRAVTRMRYQCSPYHEKSALHPVIEQFERAAEFTRGDGPENRLRKMEAVLLQALPAEQLSTVAPLFAAMLSIPAPHYPALPLTPQRQKERTLAALIDQIAALSAQQPILMVFEDLHWIDPTTEEVLDMLISRVANLPVLLVATYRPEYTPRWQGEPHVTVLSVSRLNRRLGVELATSVTGGQSLPSTVLDEILAKTDGIPLFVEELTRAVLEGGLLRAGESGYELAGPLTTLAIPSTLQDSLMSRLDRLSEVREVAQTGACIGREFTRELLAAVLPIREQALESALTQLEDADLIVRRGVSPQATYSFKHALVQDAAYASLLQSRRQVLHRMIGEALEQRFSDLLVTAPEDAAHHFSAASLPARASAYWLRAGRRAIERSAITEAIAHLRAGLKEISSLPPGTERDRLELPLQAELGTALGTALGYTPPEVESVFARARDLVRVVGDVPERFTILFGLYASFLMRADYPTSWGFAHELLELGSTAADPGARVLAEQCMASSALFTGDFAMAWQHASRGMDTYRAAGYPRLGAIYGFDPGVLCYEWASWALLITGSLDQADAVCNEGHRIAKATDHVLTIATNLIHTAGYYSMREDAKATHSLAAQAGVYCAEHGILLRQAESEILEGWAEAELGDPANGAPRIEGGLATWRQLGARIWDSGWYLCLARTHLLTMNVGRCRAALSEALNAAYSHGEHAYTAEVHRIEGLVHLEEGEQQEAETAFLKAVELARRQGAKLWELRATIALGRLWNKQGRPAAAGDMIKAIVARFDEGHGSEDLTDAKALITELDRAAFSD